VSQNYSYFFAFCWGLAVLFSFIGFGRALSSIAGWKNKEILGWGMQAALGIAVVISIAGVLLLFSLAHQPVLVALVVIGVVLYIFFVLNIFNFVREFVKTHDAFRFTIFYIHTI
jgi:hypothetical protein